MALTSLALCSRALLKLGANTIASFSDGTAEAEISANLFPSIRDAMLSAHPWSFATRQTRLARLAAAPVADFSRAYQLPADFLRALSAGADERGRGLDFRIIGKTLHANSGTLVLTHIYRPVETDYPPFFDQALITRLAAEFCIPLTESAQRAEYLSAASQEEFARARIIDSQQETPGRVEDFTLIDVRT